MAISETNLVVAELLSFPKWSTVCIRQSKPT